MTRNLLLFIIAGTLLVGCSSRVQTNQNVASPAAQLPTPAETQPAPVPTPSIPKLQSELLDDRNKTTAFAIGTFDFRNFSYPLPHGWENPDGSDVTLTNGKLEPVANEAKEAQRIGISYVTTKYLDVTGDGEDEAVVILKIETAGSAIPQMVYIYSWKNGEPELIWNFRTGDRADGGLKDIRVENGMLVVELYGEDRFLLGQMETGKITDDREQLCCPTHYTRSTYKWNGNAMLMQGKRLTFSMADPNAAPVENLGDKVNSPQKSKK